MKLHLNEVLDILGIDEFRPNTYKAKTPGMVRDYYTREIGDTKFMLMSNEFTLDKNRKKVGAPDPEKEIYCVILDRIDDKFDYVIQYSNKAGAESLSSEATTYGRQ